MSPTGLIEIRVPVSPTAEFALMLSVLHRSLLKYSGLEDFRLTAMIGGPQKDYGVSQILADWLAPDVQSVIVDPRAFDLQGIHATAARRISFESEADVIILMDADMVVCGEIADVCAEIAATPSVAGVVAHVPPRLSPSDWTRLYQVAGLGQPEFPYVYTGFPTMFRRLHRQRPGAAKAPPYFNYGFVVMTSSDLAAIRNEQNVSAVAVDEFLSRPPVWRKRRFRLSRMFRSQMALTLAIERAGLEHRSLGMRYNFPNDSRLEELHPKELEDARVIHLLRRSQGFDKQLIYNSMDSLRGFAAHSRISGALEIARRTIGGILPDLEGKELPHELAQTRWHW